MRHALFISAIAAALGANAHTRDAYFGFGVALPTHASAKLAGWHDRSSARVGMRLVVGKHLNKWLTLEGEGYYAKIKVNGTAAGDRSAASAIGAMINGLVRKDYERVSVWGGVGVGLSRNTAFDYERYIVTSSGPTFRTQLKGIGCNRFAMQLKLGITHVFNERLDLALSASHLVLGRFSRVDISDPNLAQVPFRASVTSINVGLQFKI